MTGGLPRSWAVQVLGLAAGYADAAAYLGLGHVFAANMTGNTVLLGVDVVSWASGRRLLSAPPLPIASLAAFALGTLVAALLLRRLRWGLGYRSGLVLEAVLLAGVAAGWTVAGRHPDLYGELALLVVLSTAMGTQGAVAHRVGVKGVPTVVVTSSMVNALVDAVSGRRPVAPAVAWAVYLVGGAAGAAGIELLGDAVLWPPPVVLAVLAATSTEAG